MITRSLLAAVVAVAFAAPALAAHCPADVKAIDAAMSKVKLSSAQMTEVSSLRNEGDALHKAGSHKESVDKLAKAMRLILNNM